MLSPVPAGQRSEFSPTFVLVGRDMPGCLRHCLLRTTQMLADADVQMPLLTSICSSCCAARIEIPRLPANRRRDKDLVPTCRSPPCIRRAGSKMVRALQRSGLARAKALSALPTPAMASATLGPADAAFLRATRGALALLDLAAHAPPPTRTSRPISGARLSAWRRPAYRTPLSWREPSWRERVAGSGRPGEG
jgi:hypothetical protein